MLRLDNAPQAKVRTDCFSTSLSVCLASLTEGCVVIVMYYFNRGSERALYSDIVFIDINILWHCVSCDLVVQICL